MKSEIKITREKFLHELLHGSLFQGSSFIGFDSMTVVPLKGGKKNPMQNKVKKERLGALCLVFTNKNTNSYENMVNARLAKEGKEPNFKVGQRAWGERMRDIPVVRNTKDDVTTYYLEVIEAQTAKSLAQAAENMGILLSEGDKESLQKYAVAHESIKKSEMKYFLDGVEILKKDIEGLESDKEEGDQGGLGENNKVIIRSYKIESLTRVTIGGKTYILQD